MAISDKGKQVRGKKEGLIQKIVNLIKKILFGLTLLAIVHYVWKFSWLALKFLYWLLGLKYFALHAISTWIKHKNDKHEEVIVHYEDAKHSHHHPEVHYTESDDHYEESDHGYHEHKPWDRQYAQNLAYAQQKPQSFLGSLLS